MINPLFSVSKYKNMRNSAQRSWYGMRILSSSWSQKYWHCFLRCKSEITLKANFLFQNYQYFFLQFHNTMYWEASDFIIAYHLNTDFDLSMYGIWLILIARWRHQMETYSALLALCNGNPPVIGGFPSQRPVMRSFAVFIDVHLSKRLSQQSRCWWFETPSRSLQRHRNVQDCPRSHKYRYRSSYYICDWCMGPFRCYHTWLPSNKSGLTYACNSTFDTI